MKPESKEHHTVVVLFLQKDEEGKPVSLLLGKSLNKFCKGYIIPPGGHIEPGDDAYATAIHESMDEVGLRPAWKFSKTEQVGAFSVSYENGVVVHMLFLMTSEWTGNLNPNPKDFEWARFIPLDELSSVRSEMPPGDPAFISSILGGFYTTATMQCGKDLTEVREFNLKSVPFS